MNKKVKTAIITGATSGIGKETAIALAQKGYQLVLPVRNPEKGQQLKASIEQHASVEPITIMPCDLESLQSVRDFAEAFISQHKTLDLLINNAGIWETKHKRSKDGFEKNFAVNHLAPFLLTHLLLECLQQTPQARIINVASEAHRVGKIHFEDIHFSRGFGSMKSYAQSKLANILFTRKMAQQLNGKGTTVNCLHPGVVATRLFDKFPAPLSFLFRPFMRSPRQGAQTSIYLASSPEVAHISGAYFSNSKMRKPAPHARSQNTADRLWDLSLKLTAL